MAMSSFETLMPAKYPTDCPNATYFLRQRWDTMQFTATSVPNFRIEDAMDAWYSKGKSAQWGSGGEFVDGYYAFKLVMLVLGLGNSYRC